MLSFGHMRHQTTLEQLTLMFPGCMHAHTIGFSPNLFVVHFFPISLQKLETDPRLGVARFRNYASWSMTRYGVLDLLFPIFPMGMSNIGFKTGIMDGRP